MRVGIGYDVHPLVEGRKLILGGLDIPFAKGLSGHSDADVLTHAVMDALLGACALGDIGTHFPPSDPQYKGISSLLLLERVRDLLQHNGWKVGNVDATVVAEKPRLAPFMDEIRRRLARALGIEVGRISVKATTSEKLGAVGRGEGISALAIAAVETHKPA
jgi:2-C-methyl-D-erythritol 2,4-cyclodiphosphate synthase